MSHDQAMGVFQDPILLKSDGMPTYHLANVVDDHFMRITHVVRATEWMSSTPKHVHLYNCFGWTPPKFVHVSLLQDLEGRKLSKRAGDVFVSQFRERGFLPEALNNFAALLGWSHDGESDVLDMEQLVKQFRTDRLTTGNTKVDHGKLEYLQRQHARRRISRGGEDEKHILDVVEAEVYKLFGDKLARPTGELMYRMFH
jgi:glutamyl-tRNA synthetase